jgi:hypothetical protein
MSVVYNDKTLLLILERYCDNEGEDLQGFENLEGLSVPDVIANLRNNSLLLNHKFHNNFAYF